MTTRAQMLAKIAKAHTDWSLRHGDTVPYVAGDASPHVGETTDLSMWQADRSAPPDIDDPLMRELRRILDEGYDEPDPELPDLPDDD